MRGKCAALFAFLLLFSLSFAQDYCEVPPTVRTYVSAEVDEAQHVIVVSAYNETIDVNGRLVRMPIPNGLLVVMQRDSVRGGGGQEYETCKALTGISGETEGKIVLGYEPPTGDVTRSAYTFTFCPVINNATMLSECAAVPDPNNYGQALVWRDQYGDPRYPWRDNRIPPCAGVGGTPYNYPQMLPSRGEVYLENEQSPDVAQLCWPLMLIAGLLVGAMFASGKNPMGAFDFSSPRMSRGKQYQMRAQSKSFDVVSTVFAAKNISSLSATSKQAYKVEGGKVMDSAGNHIGNVVGGKVLGLDGKEMKGFSVAQIALGNDGKVIGKVVGKGQDQKVVDGKGKTIASVKDGKVVDEKGKEIGTLQSGALQSAWSLKNIHTEDRVGNLFAGAGKWTGRQIRAGAGKAGSAVKGLFAKQGAEAAKEQGQGRVGEQMVGSALGIRLTKDVAAKKGGSYKLGAGERGGIRLGNLKGKEKPKEQAFVRDGEGKLVSFKTATGQNAVVDGDKVMVGKKQIGTLKNDEIEYKKGWEVMAPTVQRGSSWATFWATMAGKMEQNIGSPLMPLMSMKGGQGGMLTQPVSWFAAAPDTRREGEKQIERIGEYNSSSQWWAKIGNEQVRSILYKLIATAVVISASSYVSGRARSKGFLGSVGSSYGAVYFSDYMFMPVFNEFAGGLRAGWKYAAASARMEEIVDGFSRRKRQEDSELAQIEERIKDAQERKQAAQKEKGMKKEDKKEKIAKIAGELEGFQSEKVMRESFIAQQVVAQLTSQDGWRELSGTLREDAAARKKFHHAMTGLVRATEGMHEKAQGEYADASGKQMKALVDAYEKGSDEAWQKALKLGSQARAAYDQVQIAASMGRGAQEALDALRIIENKGANAAARNAAYEKLGVAFANALAQQRAYELKQAVLDIRDEKKMDAAVGKYEAALSESGAGTDAQPMSAKDIRNPQTREEAKKQFEEYANLLDAHASMIAASSSYQYEMFLTFGGAGAFYGGMAALGVSLAPAVAAAIKERMAGVSESVAAAKVLGEVAGAYSISNPLEQLREKGIDRIDPKKYQEFAQEVKTGVEAALFDVLYQPQHYSLVEEGDRHFVAGADGKKIAGSECKVEPVEGGYYVRANIPIPAEFGGVGVISGAVFGAIAPQTPVPIKRGVMTGETFSEMQDSEMEGKKALEAARGLISDRIARSLANYDKLVSEKGVSFAAAGGFREWEKSAKESNEALDALVRFAKLGVDVEIGGEEGAAKLSKNVQLAFAQHFEPTESPQQIAEMYRVGIYERLRSAIDAAGYEIKEGENPVEWLKKNEDKLKGKITVELEGSSSCEVATQQEKNEKLAQERAQKAREALLGEIFEGLPVEVSVKEARVSRYYGVNESSGIGKDEYAKASEEFDALMKSWKGAANGESEVMRAIKDGTIIATDADGKKLDVKSLSGLNMDEVKFFLNDRKQFEEKYSSGTMDDDGNKSGPRWKLGLEDAFASMRKVDASMSFEIERNSAEIPLAGLLAGRYAASASIEVLESTNTVLGMRKYNSKMEIEKQREHVAESLEISRQSLASMQSKLELVAETGGNIDVLQDAKVLGKYNYRSAEEALNGMHNAASNGLEYQPASYERAVKDSELFDKFYYEQPHMQRAQLWENRQPVDMEDAFKRTVGQLATGGTGIATVVETARFATGHGMTLPEEAYLDAKLYTRSGKEVLDMTIKESEKVMYRQAVTNKIDNREGQFASIKPEMREEVCSFAEKVANEPKRDELIGQFLAKKPDERLKMTYEYESEEGKKQFDGAPELASRFGLTGAEGEKFVDEFRRVGERARVKMLRKEASKLFGKIQE